MPTDLYFNWLIELINDPEDENLIDDNEVLIDIFYHRPFYLSPGIDMDRNRVSDGLDLRRKFMEVRGFRSYYFEMPECSILELLIGMALRCDEIMGGGIIRWFWEMIDNLGVKNCQDDGFINYILDNFVGRKYDFNGKNGGIFIVKNPRNSLKTTELWYQMCWYLSETML